MVDYFNKSTLFLASRDEKTVSVPLFCKHGQTFNVFSSRKQMLYVTNRPIIEKCINSSVYIDSFSLQLHNQNSIVSCFKYVD